MRSEKLLLQLQGRLKKLELELQVEKEKNLELQKKIEELKKARVSTRSKSKKSSVKKSEE